MNIVIRLALTGTDAQTVRPYRSRLGASLRRATRLAVLQRTPSDSTLAVRPYRSRLRASLHESYCCAVRPYMSRTAVPCVPTIVIRWGRGRRRGAGRGRARR